MEFTNLNIISFFIAIFAWMIITFFFYKLYFKQLKFNSEYKLLSSFKYFYVKYIFLILSLFIILFSMFWIKYWVKNTVNNNKGVDMMFVLDVSKSMNVADISDSNYNYTRLDIVKNSISKFVVNHKQDRFWLIIFAGDAISNIPLTTDHDLFLTFLKWVDYRNLIKQGSDFKKALSLWINRFNNNDDRSKALIFISDGWDVEDNIEYDSIKELSQSVKWISYFVVWVWTKAWWRIITWRDVFGRYLYQQYKWQYVVSKINRSNLRDISSALDSSYFDLSRVDDLNKLDSKINSLEKKVITKNINWEKWDLWRVLWIFSFIGFILFLILYIFEDKIYFLIRRDEK